MCLEVLYSCAADCFRSWMYPLPSFADPFVSIDHSHDGEIRKVYAKLSFAARIKVYNPAIEQEKEYFQKLHYFDQAMMLQRNALLLSRLFIRHASSMGLLEAFQDRKRIRILDVGCGNALNLMGILAYFGPSRVDYVGVDVSAIQIAECRETYHSIDSVQFLDQDVNNLSETFDLILIQHPPIQKCRDQVRSIFEHAICLLATNGRIYSTFYYESEADYFQRTILPNVPGTLQKNQSFVVGFQDSHTGELYCPEQYSFLSGGLTT